jgi:hypothetical protein
VGSVRDARRLKPNSKRRKNFGCDPSRRTEKPFVPLTVSIVLERNDEAKRNHQPRARDRSGTFRVHASLGNKSHENLENVRLPRRISTIPSESRRQASMPCRIALLHRTGQARSPVATPGNGSSRILFGFFTPLREEVDFGEHIFPKANRR